MVCLAGAFLCALPVFGALGADISSVRDDQIRMSAALRVSQQKGYTLHELRAANGLLVREYASSSGKIFAVTWQGPWAPNLQHLLGAHFEEFQQALKSQSANSASHGPVVVRLPGMVVELAGHMRAFVGRAYLADEVPNSVRAEEIR